MIASEAGQLRAIRDTSPPGLAIAPSCTPPRQRLPLRVRRSPSPRSPRRRRRTHASCRAQVRQRRRASRAFPNPASWPSHWRLLPPRRQPERCPRCCGASRSRSGVMGVAAASEQVLTSRRYIRFPAVRLYSPLNAQRGHGFPCRQPHLSRYLDVGFVQFGNLQDGDALSSLLMRRSATPPHDHRSCALSGCATRRPPGSSRSTWRPVPHPTERR